MNIIIFLKSNPLIYISLLFVIFLLLILLVLKFADSNAKKKNKTENKVDASKAETQKVEPSQEQKEEKKGFVKVFKRKEKVSHVKSIEKVYKREEKPEQNIVSQDDRFKQISDREEEFLKKMQFVNKDKNVSKLVKIEEQEPVQNDILIDEPQEEIDNEKVVSNTGHFNKSVRMMSYVENDNLSDMFASHIGDKYMNIGNSNHICDEKCFTEGICARASAMIANSMTRVVIDPDNPSSRVLDTADVESFRREELAKMISNTQMETNYENINQDFLDEDDVDLSLKNILLTDSLMNRKRNHH